MTPLAKLITNLVDRHKVLASEDIKSVDANLIGRSVSEFINIRLFLLDACKSKDPFVSKRAKEILGNNK